MTFSFKNIFLILFLSSFSVFAQLEEKIKSIEKRISKHSMDGFEKLEVDLDNDNDIDYIYLYQCAEPKCIEVYLNKNGMLEKVISEFCAGYSLYDNNKGKILRTELFKCCGESPFTSIRKFNFKNNKVLLKENYVLFNESYELLEPSTFLSKTYNVEVLNNNYNVRFSSNIKEYSEENSLFSCESKTNIIGKVKKGSVLKVLSKLIKPDRIWLFVEIEDEQLNKVKCYSPINFNFKNQKLRGWISGRYVKQSE